MLWVEPFRAVLRHDHDQLQTGLRTPRDNDQCVVCSGPSRGAAHDQGRKRVYRVLRALVRSPLRQQLRAKIWPSERFDSNNLEDSRHVKMRSAGHLLR